MVLVGVVVAVVSCVGIVVSGVVVVGNGPIVVDVVSVNRVACGRDLWSYGYCLVPL